MATATPGRDDLVAVLRAARTGVGPAVDLSPQRLTQAEALDLQLALFDQLIADGDARGGWKISFTSGRGRDLMGADFRPFGFILRSHRLSSPAEISLGSVANLAIEPELCLVVGKPLSGPVSPDEVRAAVDAVAAAFELNERRVSADADQGTILADGINNWGIVVGDTAPADRAANTVSVRFSRDGTVVSDTTPGDTMDDPFLSLARVSALLGEHGRGLQPGDHVITGSFAQAPVTEPGRWRAEFTGIGAVALTVLR